MIGKPDSRIVRHGQLQQLVIQLGALLPVRDCHGLLVQLVPKVPLPGNSWAYDDSLQGLVPDYDPEGAKKLLEEAGGQGQRQIDFAGNQRIQTLVGVLNDLKDHLIQMRGYPDGFEITLSYAASVERDRVGIVLQQMWKNDLNVDLILDATET